MLFNHKVLDIVIEKTEGLKYCFEQKNKKDWNFVNWYVYKTNDCLCLGALDNTKVHKHMDIEIHKYKNSTMY